MVFRVVLQPEIKLLFITGVQFDYLEVCIESCCYWCDWFAL